MWNITFKCGTSFRLLAKIKDADRVVSLGKVSVYINRDLLDLNINK